MNLIKQALELGFSKSEILQITGLGKTAYWKHRVGQIKHLYKGADALERAINDKLKNKPKPRSGNLGKNKHD